MQSIIKYWKSTLNSVNKAKSKQVTTPNSCVEQKIQISKVLLKAAFENESKLFLAEFQKPDCYQSANCTEYIREVMYRHLNTLFTKSIQSYVNMCSYTYFSALYSKKSISSISKKSYIMLPYEERLRKLVAEATSDIIVSFYESKTHLEKFLLQQISEGKDDIRQLAEYFKSGWKQLENHSYRLKVSRELLSIALTGRTQYTFICENADSSCESCMSMDGHIFDLDDAECGKNLPPLHPNCRCTIAAFPPLTELPEIPEIAQGTPVEFLWDVVESAVQQLEGKVDSFTDDLGAIWNYFFKQNLEDTYGTYSTIIIDGKEYRINLASFESVVIMPDGSFLVPELVTETDITLLKMMKERDDLPENDPERKVINDRMEEICNTEPKPERSVTYSKPYSFYLFGGDVTNNLNRYMVNATSNYTNMHNRYWAENLLEFYQIVRNGGEMDLKNQPEWQNSAYIYDGEVVSQDALGNINYGFFGAYCNIPQSVLMGGAGFAQWRSGNWKWEFMTTILDDPRDTYRVFQGIEIYEEYSQP